MAEVDLPIACNLKAIGTSARVRYTDLLTKVRAALRDRRELANGYVFQLSDIEITEREIAEWMEFERLCCPFLTIEFPESAEHTQRSLTITGPPGIKKLIHDEFTAQHR